MNKQDLLQIFNTLIDVRKASNWQGKFTSEIRHATVDHRMQKIATPLDEVIKKLRKELDNRNRKRNTKRVPTVQRLPYKDN